MAEKINFIPANQLPEAQGNEVNVMCLENGEMKQIPGANLSGPDLAITPIPYDGVNAYFNQIAGTVQGIEYGPQYVSYDPEKVVSTYEKLLAGGDVRATFTSTEWALNSWDGPYSCTYPAARIAATPPTAENYPSRLIVRFIVPWFYDHSSSGTTGVMEFVFGVDTATRTVSFVSGFIWNNLA